jgi:ubiquinone biosynthesis protein
MIKEYAESAAEVLASMRRFCRIVVLVVWHGLRFFVRGAYLFLSGRKDQCGSLLGERLASLCEALGPTFIKGGQILSSRPDLLSASVISPLFSLQDQLAPFSSALIPRMIELAFGRSIDELFASFELVPVASASIAQVHRARLWDGRDVAVKIRRPGISRCIANDLRVFGAIARVLSILPGMSTVPLAELVSEIGTPLRQQLDFKLEAANNRRFRKHLADLEYIKLPELVERLCTDNILTMEYLDETERVDSTQLSVPERKAAALAGLRALYKMIFVNGFIHADMHPGNVFVRKWGELVILDFGLVASLDAADQQDFVDFFFGLVNNEGKECARIIYKNAISRAGNCDFKAFEAAMVALIARHSALKSHEFEVTHFAYQLIETQRRFRIRGSTKFTMTILSMVVFDGICKTLYPECDFQKEARGFLITARYRREPAPKNPQGYLNRLMGVPESNVLPSVPEVRASSSPSGWRGTFRYSVLDATNCARSQKLT